MRCEWSRSNLAGVGTNELECEDRIKTNCKSSQICSSRATLRHQMQFNPMYGLFESANLGQLASHRSKKCKDRVASKLVDLVNLQALLLTANFVIAVMDNIIAPPLLLTPSLLLQTQ